MPGKTAGKLDSKRNAVRGLREMSSFLEIGRQKGGARASAV
jgi:hypothetical protein